MTELDGTLGAAFLGCLAAAMFVYYSFFTFTSNISVSSLYGVTSVQTFMYFQGHSSQDGHLFKSAVRKNII